jgi:hypothetical protein
MKLRWQALAAAWGHNQHSRFDRYLICEPSKTQSIVLIFYRCVSHTPWSHKINDESHFTARIYHTGHVKAVVLHLELNATFINDLLETNGIRMHFAQAGTVPPGDFVPRMARVVVLLAPSN